MKNFFEPILRIILTRYYGLDRTIKISNRYWPGRVDTFNLLDFVLTNHKQNCIFPIKINGKTEGMGQCTHYYENV